MNLQDTYGIGLSEQFRIHNAVCTMILVHVTKKTWRAAKNQKRKNLSHGNKASSKTVDNDVIIILFAIHLSQHFVEQIDVAGKPNGTITLEPIFLFCLF